jgi:hypothetical protein
VLLYDNGSLRAASTLSLRDLAARLAMRLGVPVHPASARFSDQVPVGELGAPAETVATTARPAAGGRRRGGAGTLRLVALPAFWAQRGGHGPGAQPAAGAAAGRRGGAARLLVAAGQPLVDVGRPATTGWPARSWTGAAATAAAAGGGARALAGVRPRPARWRRWRPCAPRWPPRCPPWRPPRPAGRPGAPAVVAGCSMERRPGPAYAFNEPLLERLLRAPFDAGLVVVGMLFLSPGRHAGQGDVAAICAAAEAEAAAGAGRCAPPWRRCWRPHRWWLTSWRTATQRRWLGGGRM